MSKQMVVRIDDETKARFQRVSRMEGKTSSEKLRELVENYLRKADLSQVADDLWKRIGARMQERRLTEADVERAIDETRRSR
jgi:predicted DNA-binding protein